MHEHTGLDPLPRKWVGGRALENFVCPPLTTHNLAFEGLGYLPPNPLIKGAFNRTTAGWGALAGCFGGVLWWGAWRTLWWDALAGCFGGCSGGVLALKLPSGSPRKDLLLK